MTRCKCTPDNECKGEINFTDCIERNKKTDNLVALLKITVLKSSVHISDDGIRMMFELDANGVIDLLHDARNQLLLMERYEDKEQS